MAPSTTARVRRTAQNTQYTYNLARRVHTVHTYPVLSPQGATILIYGHENGVTLVWRGGRQFKPQVVEDPKKEAPKKKPPKKEANGSQNGTSSQDAIMLIDSSDDEDTAPSASSAGDQPLFEENLDECAYPEITQTLDLEFDTAVFHVSTLPLTPCLTEDASWEGTDILKEKIIFTVSCATREVFLVTLPLVPPSPLSKARKDLQESLLVAKAGNGKWGETVTLLDGQHKPSDGLAMSLIRPRSNYDRNKSSERSESTTRAAHRVVIASHSREASGTLRLWDVPLNLTTEAGRRVEPFQTEYLSKPLTSIAFNPKHSSQLLCNASPNAVRIYDYNLASMPPDDISEGPFPSQGSWLVSFYPPFIRQSTSRKPILAASWVGRGRAIFVLLADGQWGIWDIDGMSPQGSSHFGMASSGIVGDAITEFNVSGYVEGTSPLRNPARASGSFSEFVPMTPHTRRTAFLGSSGPERLAAVNGGIIVTPLPTSATTTSDESVTLWIGSSDHVFTIPGLLKFWDAQIRKSAGGGVNLFSGAQPTRMIRLNDLSVGLMGERCTSVSAIVRFPETGGMSAPGGEGLPVDVVVCGESRLVIIRESDETVGTRIGGVISRRKGLSDRARDTSAIIVHPKPEQPASVAYNLSFGPRKKLSRQTHPEEMDESVENKTAVQFNKGGSPGRTPARPAPSTLFFGPKLSAAADDPDDDEDFDRAELEREVLDIMAIDRKLDVIDHGRGRGRKKVMFDS
ncbi:hypothetical protein GGR50DRAFT_696523 [Xylaria sp. CBS 124048]|nr:hypothetical protein GGR50DRAFT_696523 [Xylaria sp. CBS 124048]